jgi:hypothetical protein
MKQGWRWQTSETRWRRRQSCTPSPIRWDLRKVCMPSLCGHRHAHGQLSAGHAARRLDHRCEFVTYHWMNSTCGHGLCCLEPLTQLGGDLHRPLPAACAPRARRRAGAQAQARRGLSHSMPAGCRHPGMLLARCACRHPVESEHMVKVIHIEPVLPDLMLSACPAVGRQPQTASGLATPAGCSRILYLTSARSANSSSPYSGPSSCSAIQLLKFCHSLACRHSLKHFSVPASFILQLQQAFHS